jgi:predicted ester cyclase
MQFKTILGAAALAVTTTTAAFADNKETVSTFYDLLSNPGEQAQVDAFLAATSEDWESIGNYSGDNKDRDGFLGQVGGFGQLMPDLDWAVQDMYDAGDAVIVRSRATATPVAPFCGVDGQGRSCDILAIDIHELEDGVIVRTYHVEDWATAMQQLSGQ